MSHSVSHQLPMHHYYGSSLLTDNCKMKWENATNCACNILLGVNMSIYFVSLINCN